MRRGLLGRCLGVNREGGERGIEHVVPFMARFGNLPEKSLGLVFFLCPWSLLAHRTCELVLRAIGFPNLQVG